MPSEISQQIVKQIFADDNAAALDSVKSALNSIAYDQINLRKGEFAQKMGFDLDDTAQSVADEIEGQLDDYVDSEYQDYEGESPTDEQQLEVETDEDDETYS